MKCEICGEEKDKLISCLLLKGKAVCSSCCFAISSGDPKFLQKLKQNYKILKHDALKRCSACLKTSLPISPIIEKDKPAE